MLEQTFIHIPGIGARAERALWDQGCLSWQTLLNDPGRYSVGTADRDDVRRVLKQSADALAAGKHQYFARKLGSKEAWRAFEAFRSRCVYLDIETDGGNSGESVTAIGLYDGTNATVLVKGESLENFRDLISRYSMIVTFFGTGFDLPVLRKRFPDIRFDQIHIDLCPTLRKIGLRGGLKKIEKLCGIQRPPELDGLTGYDAVRLWRRYDRLGDERALETLVAYNRADVVSLEPLAVHAFERLCRAATGQCDFVGSEGP